MVVCSPGLELGNIGANGPAEGPTSLKSICRLAENAMWRKRVASADVDYSIATARADSLVTTQKG